MQKKDIIMAVLPFVKAMAGTGSGGGLSRAQVDALVEEKLNDRLGACDIVGTYDGAGNVVLVKNILPVGTYTLKYDGGEEMTVIGTVTVTEESTSDGDTIEGTNQIPVSTDESGEVFGYQTHKRINSSGNVASYSSDGNSNPSLGVFATGFIPVMQGDIIHLHNCYIDPDGTVDVYGGMPTSFNVHLYDNSKTSIPYYSGAACTWAAFTSNDDTDLYNDYVTDANGNVVQFTIEHATAAYIRLTLAEAGTAADAVLTIERDGVIL